jgi:hypothetical protein
MSQSMQAPDKDQQPTVAVPNAPQAAPQLSAEQQPSPQPAAPPLIEEIKPSHRLALIIRLLVHSVLIAVMFGIFYYGMTVPTTSSGVDEVARVFLIVSIPSSLVLVFSLSRSEYRKLFSKTQAQKVDIAQKIYSTPSIAFRTLLAVVIILYALFNYFPLLIAAVPFVLSIFVQNQSQQGRVPHIALRIATLISMVLLALASFGFVIIIGMFALSLRACQLSSSKCY